MCDLKKEYKKSKTFTGYKVVMRIGSDYHSPVFGLKYEEGMTLPVLFPRETLWAKIFPHNLWKSGADVLTFNWHDNNMGRTSVFVRLADAKRVAEETRCNAVVKMTIQTDLLKGTFSKEEFPVVAGKKIVKIEEIENE